LLCRGRRLGLDAEGFAATLFCLLAVGHLDFSVFAADSLGISVYF
jgi:hypothetical protein